MKTNIFRKSWSHIWPQANPQGRKWPQMDSLIMNFSSKSTLFNSPCDQKFIFLWKHTFPFPSFKKNILKGFCVLTSETRGSSYFVKTNIFWKSWSHIWPQAKPLWRKWPQMDSLVMSFSSKSAILMHMYNVSYHFSWKNTFSFRAFPSHFKKDFLSLLGF